MQVSKTANTSTTKSASVQCSASDKVVSHSRKSSTSCARNAVENSSTKVKAHSLTLSLRRKNAASVVCRQMRHMAHATSAPNEHSLNESCNLEGGEICTDKGQRCGDSRSGPMKYRWVTEYLQIRASKQKCSTLCSAFVWCNAILPHHSGSYHADMRVREIGRKNISSWKW